MSDGISTRQRRLLLDILREAGTHLDAKELFQRAIQKDPRVSLASVYRNLHLFEELGLVDGKRLDRTRCYYEIRRSTHHYDVICHVCGRVMEFESPMIEKLVDEVQQNSAFRVTKAVLYLEGYCRQCEDKGKKR
jgi:Fur family ferric uptake transcriptional regulator